MNIGVLKGIGGFFLLLLAQALVFNHIHLFNCATPLLYVYIVTLFRRDFPQWIILVASFTMGLCVDIFSNTPGLAAASMTFVGMLQPYLLTLFLPRKSGDDPDLAPSMGSMGMERFTWYALIIVFCYCLVFFALEAFDFDNWLHWLENVGGSFALTSILLLTIEFFRFRTQHENRV
ncbi:MAG: rod shape-determining protein MreD [Prevotella sp.]|nr:rod shape-determining protein MreD [Prevotella sp.]